MGFAVRLAGRLVAGAVAVAVVAGCTTAVDGVGTIGLSVVGDSHSAFDTSAARALGAVESFWTATYPKIAHGHRLPPLKGKLYSVDGSAVIRTGRAPADAKNEKCLSEKLGFIIDNAAYCPLDDSIIWDRSPDHLLPVLARAYGPAVTALVFAHEFGHAIQHRLHLDDTGRPTIDLESQADCAAGAFAGAALRGRVPGFTLTISQLDRALEGYLQMRDSTPESPQQISHGNGFDRLNALQQGITSGASYCYGASFFTDRHFTERGYVNDNDYLDNGNQPLAQVLSPKGLLHDLNRYWTAAAQHQGKTFSAVRTKRAPAPPCAAPSDRFGYCPSDNTVYYSAAFAHRAYYSITALVVNQKSGDVRLVHHQAGDFALGMMFAIGWGFAALHQLHGRPLGSTSALVNAICTAGAYAENINRPEFSKAHPYVLSPPDMDEATSAVLQLVGAPGSFGARGTSGLQRVQAFVRGYTGGRSAC